MPNDTHGKAVPAASFRRWKITSPHGTFDDVVAFHDSMPQHEVLRALIDHDEFPEDIVVTPLGPESLELHSLRIKVEDGSTGETRKFVVAQVRLEGGAHPYLHLVAPDATTAEYAYGLLQLLIGRRRGISLEAAASEVEMELDAEGVEVTLRIQR